MGSQGYHGLKYKISDNFVIMLKAGSYFFKTYINCENNFSPEMEISGRKPDIIFVNGKKIESLKPLLNKGINSVVLLYTKVEEKKYTNHWEMVDLRERSAVIFKKPSISLKSNEVLSMKWYQQDGIFNYDVYGNNKKLVITGLQHLWG